MKSKKRIITVLLAVVMSLTFVGCNMQDTTWAFEQNGVRMPSGVYLYYMLSAHNEAVERYMEENEADSEPSLADIRRAQIDGQTGEAWIANRAWEMVMEHYGLLYQFQTLGLSLSEEAISANTSVAENTWNAASRYFEANGVAQSSLEIALLNHRKRDQVFQTLYGAGGAFEISDAELMSRFEEDFVKVESITISAWDFADEEDEAPDFDELLEEARTAAASYLERLNTGTPMSHIVAEHFMGITVSPESAGQIVDQSEYTTILFRSDLEHFGEIGEAIESATNIFSLTETETGIFIVRQASLSDDPENLERHRHHLMTEMKHEEFLERLREWGEATSPVANQAAISRYTVSRLQTDFESFM